MLDSRLFRQFLYGVLRCGKAVLQRVTDLTVGFGITDPVYLPVESQHTASLIAVVAAPEVLGEVDVHFAPLITADRAVGIYAVRLSAPDMQMQQLGHIHDVERELLWLRHRATSLPSSCVNHPSAGICQTLELVQHQLGAGP